MLVGHALVRCRPPSPSDTQLLIRPATPAAAALVPATAPDPATPAVVLLLLLLPAVCSPALLLSCSPALLHPHQCSACPRLTACPDQHNDLSAMKLDYWPIIDTACLFTIADLKEATPGLAHCTEVRAPSMQVD